MPTILIPEEILSEIFLNTIPSDPPDHVLASSLNPSNVLTFGRLKNYPPWAIRQVCRRWRAVVLSLARVWAHISLAIKMTSNDSDSDGFDFGADYAGGFLFEDLMPKIPAGDKEIELANCLLPSRGPISIHMWPPITSGFDFRGGPFSGLDRIAEEGEAVERFLSAYGERITTFTLRASSMVLRGIYPINRALVNSLETCALELSDNFALVLFKPNVEGPGIFSEAKKLKNLGLGGHNQVLTYEFFKGCQIPGAQIQKLCLVYNEILPNTVNDLQATLCDCPNLVELRVAVKGNRQPGMPLSVGQPADPIGLPSLITLQLDTDHPILRWITTPSLRTLLIPSRSPNAQMSLIPFLLRSTPPLKVFSNLNDIAPRGCSAEVAQGNYDTITLARCVPHVHDLRLGGAKFNMSDLCDIIRGRLFPKLARFSCQLDTPMQPLELLSIVESVVGRESKPPSYRRRYIRVLLYSTGKAPPEEDDIAFDQRAEKLLRDTGLELECTISKGVTGLSNQSSTTASRRDMRYLP